jgi:bifunctional DNase/RNase
VAQQRQTACHASHQPSNQEPARRQFNQLGFVRVRLERVTTTKQGHYGYLVFVRHEGRKPWLGGTERGLVVHITGDTLYCLCKLLRNEPTARPMPLDILSGILTQASSQSPEEWGIVRVAITDLQHDTYIARVYFGNKRTGEVSWEQDIRPSDATYLAEQWKVPFYIDSSVWEDTAITHSELQQSERDYELPFDRPEVEEEAADGTLPAPAEAGAAAQQPSKDTNVSGILYASHSLPKDGCTPS